MSADSNEIYKKPVEEYEEEEADDEVVDTVDVAEADLCATGGSNKLLGGDGGTTHTADSSIAVPGGVADLSQFAPISDIGTEALANSSQTKIFSLNDCDVGGTTIKLTEINKGCTSFVSITIRVTSSFFSKHRDVISDFCVKVGCLWEFIDVTEALIINCRFVCKLKSLSCSLR